MKTFAKLTLALGLLALAGCNTVPMTYAEWNAELKQRKEMAEHGIEFKSRRQLRAEANELRKINDSTVWK